MQWVNAYAGLNLENDSKRDERVLMVGICATSRISEFWDK